MTEKQRTSRWSRWTLSLLLTTGLAISACGGSTADGTDAAPTRERTATLVAQKIDGGQIDIADLFGQDVVLWFWAPW